MSNVGNSVDLFIPYIENRFHLGFIWSVIQSFFMIFFAELGDKTFIMLIILQLKTNKATVLSASLFTQLVMNFIAVFVGFAIDFLLYKNLIDWIGIIFFFLYGFWLITQSLNIENQSFEKDIFLLKLPTANQSLKKEIRQTLAVIPEMIREDDKFDESSTISSVLIEKNEIKTTIDETDEEDEENEKKEVDGEMFWIIASSIAVSECGDRTQFSSMTLSAIYTPIGVLLGSSIALIMTNFLGVFLGKILIPKLNEKTLNFILGGTFLVYSIQIYLGKYWL